MSYVFKLGIQTGLVIDVHLNTYIHTICESLVKIKYFRHECSSIMYENSQKNAIKSKDLP